MSGIIPEGKREELLWLLEAFKKIKTIYALISLNFKSTS